MNGLDRLKQAAGQWRGGNTLHDPHTGGPEASTSQLSVVQLLNGRFVRADYTWSYQGKPQEGSLLIGYDPKTDELSGHWIDSWHNGNVVMVMKGNTNNEGDVTLLGSYQAGDGSPDWGWRIAITANPGEIDIIMLNIDPAGREYVAVEASYTQ